MGKFKSIVVNKYVGGKIRSLVRPGAHNFVKNHARKSAVLVILAIRFGWILEGSTEVRTISVGTRTDA